MLDPGIGSQGGKREDRVPRVKAGEPPTREPVCRGTTQYGTETLHAGPGDTFLFIDLGKIVELYQSLVTYLEHLRKPSTFDHY